MTAKWICQPCNMMCLDQKHYSRHRNGDHSPATVEERDRYRDRYRESMQKKYTETEK